MNTTQQSALASVIAAAVVEALGAHFDVDAPAKVTPTKRASRKAPAVKASTKVTCLVKANRESFVKAHAWAKGLSTLDIAIAVVHHDAPLSKGWAIGEGYATKAQSATRSAKTAVKRAL